MTDWCITSEPFDLSCDEYSEKFTCHKREPCGNDCCCKAEKKWHDENEAMMTAARNALQKLNPEERELIISLISDYDL